MHIFSLKLENASHEEIGQVVAAFSRLTRLKILNLVEGLRYFRDPWTELHDRAFRKLFTNMKELEEVDILFPENRAVNVDEVIETLVHNSPSVRSIRMMHAAMTDASLQSLSRLTGLHRLANRSYRRRSDMTTEGILSLLRGGSRNVLRKVELPVSVLLDSKQIRAEGELMLEETGRTFHEEFGFVSGAEAAVCTLRIC